MRSLARRGFTLIELLVVVSIIALLISILLPSLSSAREQARMVKCSANLRAISNGVALYVQDQRLLPGPLHAPIFRTTGDSDKTFRLWFLLDRLGPYFSRTDSKLKYADAIASCGTAALVKKDEAFDNKRDSKNPTWNRPFNYLPNTWGTTYPGYYFGWINTGYNWEGFMKLRVERDEKKRTSTGVLPAAFFAPLPMDAVRRPSGEWMIGDAWWDRVVALPDEMGAPVTTMMGTWQMAPTAEDGRGMSCYPLPRRPYHGKDKMGTNLSFFDGHAATFKGIGQNWVSAFPANKPPIK